MHIDWATLVEIAVVAAAVTVTVVLLVSFALVGSSAHGVRGTDGRHDGAVPGAHPAAGLAVAVLCTLATAAIVCFGLYLIVA